MFPQFFAYYRGSAIDEWESYIELTGGLIMGENVLNGD